VTASLLEEPTLDDGWAVADAGRDLAKVAVLERHLETRPDQSRFLRGFGVQRGAFGTSLAHDAHNVVVVGIEDDAMALVVGRLRELGDRTAQLRVDDLLERLQDLVVRRLHANEPSNAKIVG
jgi:adenine deaminase